jgi:hypothetical protein
MLFHELRQKRLDLGYVPERFGAQEYTHGAGELHVQSTCYLPAVSFVDQQEARFTFDGKSDGLCFSRIECDLELCN